MRASTGTPTTGLGVVAVVLVAVSVSPAAGEPHALAAAAALAKCLLPGACRLAGWLSTLPPREVFRDSQPVMAGTWSAVERVDELVASQLWIEVRTFKWRRLRKVAANILINTRVGVLREVGDFFYVSRADRTWANTTLVESFSVGDLTSADGGAGYSAEMPTERVAGALFHRPEILADAGPEQEEPTATEELLELLAWACDHEVIGPADRYLLLCLVDFYTGSPLITVHDDRPAELLLRRSSTGSDRMELYVFANEDGSQARLVALLDNLGKGASGAAVQSLNLMAGLAETAGLRV